MTGIEAAKQLLLGALSGGSSELSIPLTRRDAAAILRCSERKIDRLLRANILESTRVGRAVLISSASVAAMLPK